MNSLSILDETYKDYSVAPTDNWVIFWILKVKVTAGRRDRKLIPVNAGASKSI